MIACRSCSRHLHHHIVSIHSHHYFFPACLQSSSVELYQPWHVSRRGLLPRPSTYINRNLNFPNPHFRFTSTYILQERISTIPSTVQIYASTLHLHTFAHAPRHTSTAAYILRACASRQTATLFDSFHEKVATVPEHFGNMTTGAACREVEDVVLDESASIHGAGDIVES